MSLKILGLRQTICLALPKIFCTTFKSISKFYAFGFLKFNQNFGAVFSTSLRS